MSGPLLIERRGAVDWVTLDRPDRLNALDASLIDALLRYFERLYDDDDCRIVVLRGAGRAFCAGADLGGELTRHVTDDGIAASMRVQRNIRNIMLAMRRCPQPIVALLHGAAVGGGFALALASDIRIAAPDTRMSAAFIRIGIGGCDVGVSYFLPRLAGASLAHELLLTGRDLLADRALRLGLVADVVEREQLEDCAGVYVDAMLATAPMGLALTKEVANVNLDASGLEAAMTLEDRNQVMLSQSMDFREGVAAFREKRAPKFTGR
jgi:enoyl-CoA hydratase/carnithine racemase